MPIRYVPTTTRALCQCRQAPTRRMMSLYNVYVGASFAGKPQESRKLRARHRIDFPKDSDILQWRAEMLSREKGYPSKSAGEDFFYIQEMRNHSGLSFGVADGVGGWASSGFDPSLFSQALMYHAHRYSKQAWAGEPETDPLQNYEERQQVQGWELTPKECLELAHGAVLREKTVEAGSSTACLIIINTTNGLLRAANLGDSGFCIIRSSKLLHSQLPQTHFFNCPMQLSKVPLGSKYYGMAYTDSPREADVYETRLRDGDIIISYTDGLSDNVFSDEILQICMSTSRSQGSEEEQVQNMADQLVGYARSCMAKGKRVSPFEIAAARAGEHHRGGKVDDVTVVMALVRESN